MRHKKEMASSEFTDRKLTNLAGINLVKVYEKIIPTIPRVKRDKSKPLLEKCGAIRPTGF